MAETRKIAEDALRAVESLKAGLQQQHEATASLLTAVKPKDETPGRVICFAAGAALCGFLAIAGFMLMRAGFSDPPPNYVDPGVVGLYVWPLNEGQAQALDDPGVSFRASVNQLSQRVEYVATFPKALAGVRFVIAFSGSAVLRDLDSSAADVENEYTVCHQREGSEVDNQRLTCQLVTGIISSDSNGTTACRDDDDDDGETISVQFSGNARTTSSYDWAHHVTSVPYLGNVDGRGTGSVDDLVSGAYGFNYAEPNLSTCYWVLLNPKWKDHTPNTQPSFHDGDTMFWDPASDMAFYVVVSTERDAAWKGNALLAAGFLLVTMCGSLSLRTWRSGRRLQDQIRRSQGSPTARGGRHPNR